MSKTAASTLIILGCSIGAAVVTVHLCGPAVPVAAAGTAAADAQTSGAALVVAPGRQPLPAPSVVDEWASSPSGAVDGLREKGYLVAQDPYGRYIAAGPLADLPADATQIEGLPRPALTWVILQHSSPAQWDARERGYLSLNQLSTLQRIAARELGRRCGLVDSRGRPRGRDAQLVVGMWRSWQVYLPSGLTGQSRFARLPRGLRPPTVPAVAAAPLRGSVLWWSWPHIEAEWGMQPVTLAAGTYAVPELLRELSDASNARITASDELSPMTVALAATEAPLRKLVWAIGTALAADVRAEVGDETGGLSIALAEPGAPSDASDAAFSALPGLGYYTPMASPIGPHLKSLEGAGRDASTAWRFGELPLMYRNMIQQYSAHRHPTDQDDPAAHTVPTNSVVVWVKTVCVAVELRTADGGGFGSQYHVPTL